ncbi:hypothetical protein C1H46_027479 [Malus baccata]|uniref:Rx N-terminal domain-containing protein n=1 Tax=Malus baccata TaxID=106549 RepID=A0A540LKF9_MALBA|nr:hypothetical protein C1H46_027479 [Malus baccata]
MAEALISVLLEQLASVTYQHVGREVKLVLNAEKDVQEFEANLEAIRAVLEDAEQRQVKDASVRNWLEKLKDVSYKMENVLDEWKTEILKQQVEEQEDLGGTTSLVTKKKMKAVCFSIPSSCFCFGQVRRVIRGREIAHKIKILNEDLDVIAKQGERYNFRFTERVIIEQPERDETTSFVDASTIFGREQQMEDLIRKLLKESSQEESGVLVIPIVGMGGMGKTTLAQLAFNNEKNVEACFDIKIWVCVSDPFDEIKTAKAIISGAQGDSSNSNTLQDLFQRMDKDGVLEAIGEEIAKKCKGLPLAAKTLGSLMRFKKTEKEWQEVLNSKIWELEEFLTQNECFTMEVKGGNDTIEALGDKIRHLTLVLAPKGPLSCVLSSSCDLRTLATFDSKFTIVDSTLMSQLKHLRTLNLSDNSIKKLPEEIGELVHLRFIDLSRNPLKKLPNGVCNLYNLQTLRLFGCRKLEGLPQSMGKLTNLKHLYLWGCDQLKYLPKGIGRLTNLRRLDRCLVGGGKDDDEAFKLGDLRNLDQLQGRLSIEIVGDVKVVAGEHEKASPLGNKQQLSKLSISFHLEDEERSAKTLNFLRPHPNLEYLGIKVYNGSTAPNWIMSLNNLRFLHLANWKECEVLPHLGKLPSLETLYLIGMKGVKKVGVEFLGIEKETSSASSCITLFPKLKKLCFYSMKMWEEWKGVEEWKEEDSHIDGKRIVEAEDAVELPERPSTSGIVEAEDAV